MFYFQLRNELWKLFGKKRTYIGFGAILVAQVIIVLLFRYSRASHGMVQQLERNGYSPQEFISSLTVATVMLLPIAYVLLPLYVTLVGGDLVAKEAEDGTLRMILSRPISRYRLLLVKWVAGSIFSGLLVLALGLVGELLASLFFRWGGMFAFIPGEMFSALEPAAGLKHYIAAHGLLIAKACTLFTLAFMFSSFNIKPAAATILALSVFFVSWVLMNIPFFKDLQEWFFTYHLNIWQSMLLSPVPWPRVFMSLSLLAGFNLSFLVIGCTAFQVRDVKT